MYWILIAIIIILFLVVIWLFSKENGYIEHMVNIPPLDKVPTWSKDPKCPFTMTQVYLDVLNEYAIKETKNSDWTIAFPCTYDAIEDEINKVNPTDPNQRIFIVNNCNSIASKSDLWANLVKKYGRNKAETLSPLTYVLYDNNDMELFNKEYMPGNLYIIKKNIQRQEGLKITQDKTEILNANKDGYVVCQELLQNPYLIHDRKINLRFYVLLVCQNNEIALYVHHNGFMYYTKMPFEKGSSKMWSNITTGYIERWIYHINPLSHEDFRKYLDNNNRPMTQSELEVLKANKQMSEVVFSRIYDLIKTIVLALDGNICYESKLKQHISFQLFGADVAIDDNLEPKIMEFNIGPNLGIHDEEDREIKHKVVQDIFKTLKIVPDIDNGFIQLI